MALTIELQAGLDALNQGQEQEAIQIFETFCQNAAPDSRSRLQAQMHLVKAYQAQGQVEQAIALCEALITCSNAQVQIWAQQVMKEFIAPQPDADSLDAEPAADQPLPDSPPSNASTEPA